MGWLDPNTPNGQPEKYQDKKPLLRPTPLATPVLPIPKSTPQRGGLPKGWMHPEWFSALQPSAHIQSILTYTAAGLGALAIAVGIGKGAKLLALKNIAKAIFENPAVEKRAVEKFAVSNTEKATGFFERAKNWFSDWKLDYGQKMNRLLNIDGGPGGLKRANADFSIPERTASANKPFANDLNVLTMENHSAATVNPISKTHAVMPTKVAQLPYVQDTLLSSAEQKNKALLLNITRHPDVWVKKQNTSSYNPFELLRRFKDKRMLAENFVLKGPVNNYSGPGFAQFDKLQLREIRRVADYANQQIKNGSKKEGKKLWSVIDTLYHRKSEFPIHNINANQIIRLEKFRARQPAYEGLNYFELSRLHSKFKSSRYHLRSVIFDYLDVGQSIIGLVVTSWTKPAKAKLYSKLIENLQNHYDELAARIINSKIKPEPAVESLEKITAKPLLVARHPTIKEIILKPLNDGGEAPVLKIEKADPEPSVTRAEIKDSNVQTEISAPEKPVEVEVVKTKKPKNKIEAKAPEITDIIPTSLNPTGIQPGLKRRNLVKDSRGTKFTDENGNRFLELKGSKGETVFLRKVEPLSPNTVRSSRTNHKITWEMFDDASPDKRVAAYVARKNKLVRIQKYEQEIRDGVSEGTYKVDMHGYVYQTDSAGNLQPLSLKLITVDGEKIKYVICNKASVAVTDNTPPADFLTGL